ncbi:MAG: GxxExxY protein [bacterium]
MERQGCAPNPERDTPVASLNELTERVIGACIEVHRELGPGFLESVYEEALAEELSLRCIPFERQHSVIVKYKARNVGEHRVDLIVNRRLVVELKTVDSLLPIHTAQVISYLKASGLHLGLLVNFKAAQLATGIKRIAL